MKMIINSKLHHTKLDLVADLLRQTTVLQSHNPKKVIDSDASTVTKGKFYTNMNGISITHTNKLEKSDNQYTFNGNGNYSVQVIFEFNKSLSV